MKASSADFAALWAQKPSPGWRESPLDTAMIEPRFLSTMGGAKTLQAWKAAAISPRSFAWKASPG